MKFGKFNLFAFGQKRSDGATRVFRVSKLGNRRRVDWGWKK